jgi:tetratricopeptide (TPR) repeat protein
LERGLRLIEGLPFGRELRGQLGEQLALTRRMELADELHALAEEVRVLFAASDVPPARRALIGERCEALWQRRAAIAKSLGVTRGSGTHATGDSARGADAAAADLQDVALFAADVRAARSPADAVRMLDEAEAMFGTSAVLAHRRELLGGSAPPAPARQTPPAPGTAWGHAVLGRSYLAAGDLSRAWPELTAALQCDPGGKWPNFYYGLCAFRLGRHDEAVAAFSVCVGTSPDLAGCFYNRGLAYAALGRDEQALRDYDRALQLDPAHAAAALNRGMLHYGRGQFDRAAADLALALQHGADAATVHYDLALVHRAAKQPGLAADHAALALEQNPAHPQARQLLDALRRETAATSAGAGAR